MDLLVGTVIFALILLSVSVINIFSQKEIRISDRNSQCQKEAAYVLEYIIKEIYNGIGDFSHPAVVSTTIDSNPSIIIRKDSNRNGMIDLIPADLQSAFVYNADSYEIFYYPDVSSPSRLVISKNIFMPDFVPAIKDNYITIEITACWDPGGKKSHADCGSQDNPLVTMKNRITMPSVSTH
jgi:hypothetical protein